MASPEPRGPPDTPLLRSPTPLPARHRTSRRKVATVSYQENTTSESEGGVLPSLPSAKSVKRKRSLQVVEDEDFGARESHEGTESDLTALEDEASPASSAKKRASPKKKQRRKKAAVPTESAVDDDTVENLNAEDAPQKKPKKPRKPREPKPEPVYVIPDVEKLDTSFAGRLGYACLNTILRNKKPAAESVFCSRTCRIDSIKKNGSDWVKELGRQNMKDLVQLIEWNEANNIRFMRLSSEMFPFAAHLEYGYSLDYCAAELRAAGDLANKLGHRLTTHPGQFTQLGSPREEVVQNAVRDLSYHAEMLGRMGIGKDGVMIIHGGGVYGDKQAALERIKKSYTELLPQNVKDRLVLENDEMCYSAEDLLPLCEELDIPLVFDYHHDWILPSSIPRDEIIARANAIFARKGIKPKQHLSEPRPGAVTVMERRAHSDRCQRLPDGLPDDMDLMIEAKDKEQAVLHLYRIYGLHPVVHANLRPPAENETKETKGRKSAKGTGRKKAADTGVVEEDDEAKFEDPVVEVDEDDARQANVSAPKRTGRRTRAKTTPVKPAQLGDDLNEDADNGNFEVQEQEDEDPSPPKKLKKSAKALPRTPRRTKGKNSEG